MRLTRNLYAEDRPVILMLVLYISVGLLISGLSLPLMWRKIPPNHWYGFRVRQTLENADVWYAANEFSAKRLLWLGIATVVAAVTLFFLTTRIDVYAMSLATVLLVGLGVSLIQSFRYLRTFGADR